MSAYGKSRTRALLLPFRTWKVSTIFLASLITLAGYLMLSNPPRSAARGNLTPAIRSFAAGQSSHTIVAQLESDTKTVYMGSTALKQAMEGGTAEPLNMKSDDFNGDGMGDLVIGYAANGGGILSLRAGNLQAIAPDDPDVFQGIANSRYPSPFLTRATLYSLPEAPALLAVGDFDADGYGDVVAANRGSDHFYFLAGDGHGRLNSFQEINLPGRITGMQAGPEQLGSLTRLAFGLVAAEGARIALYDAGFKSDARLFPVASKVTALAFGRLDSDDQPDLVAVAGTELFVVHSSALSSQSAEGAVAQLVGGDTPGHVEQAEIPVAANGVVVGDFIFDRAHQLEIGLLGDDGKIYVYAYGELDGRPYTADEKEAVRLERIAIRRGEKNQQALTALLGSMVRQSKQLPQWQVAEVLETGITPVYSAGAMLFSSRHNANLPTDDLIVGDAVTNSVKTFHNVKDARKLGTKNGDSLAATESLTTEGAPLAFVSMRTSVGVEPGTVVLQQGMVEPQFTIEAPLATFVVDRTDDNASAAAQVCDAINNNNNCSLRGAIIKANATVGADVVMLAAGTTYTLTLGPFDDEFNFGGDSETTGDLDIFDTVSITGGNRDTTIIQMGTLVPAVGTINKDRVMETNDFIRLQHSYNVTLSNLTIQNGNAPRTPAPDNYNTAGGGIMYDGFESNTNSPSGVLTLTNCKVSSNTAAGQGGGITTVDATLILQTTSIVSANTCTFAAGGGISYNGGNTVAGQNLQINGSTIGGPLVADGNQAIDTTFGIGGGVDSVGGAGCTVSNSALIQNNVSGETSGANGGGGMHFGNTPTIAISNSTLSNNLAKLHGGGIWVSARNAVTNAASTIQLTSVTMQNNQADSDTSGNGDGGALYNFFGSMTLNNTSGGALSGNSAFNGGGIASVWTGNSIDATASLTLTSGTAINTNSARNNGGGLSVNPGAATTFGAISLTGITFTGNTANSDSSGGGDGGGVFVGSGPVATFNGITIDSNVANSGTGDGIKLTGGSISASGAINLNGNDSLDISGGTFTSTSGTLSITGNFTRSTTGTFNHNSGTITFNGNGAQAINGTASSETFNNFIVNKSGGTLSAGGSTTLITTNNLTMTLGSFTAPATLDINGNTLLNGGTLTAGTSITAAGNWTNNGGVFTPGAGTVTFDGAAGQTIDGTAVSQTFNNFAVNKAGGTLSTAGSTNSLTTSNLTMTLGTFTAPATLDINGNALFSGGTLTAGANITAAGDWTNNGGTFTPGSGTVTFDGAGAQNLNGSAATQTFNNFMVNKAGGTLTVGGSTTTLNINGAVTLAQGTFAAGTATSIVLSNGNWTNNGGVFTPGSSVVTFSNTVAPQSINGTAASQTFNGITVAKTAQTLSVGGSTGTLTLNGNLTLTSGTFDPGTATLINVGGNWTNNGGTFIPGAGTVTFVGGAAQNLNGSAATQTFNNFSVNKSGGSLTGAGSTTTLTLTGNMSIVSGTFAAGTLTTINVPGDWANSGTFTGGSSTVNLTGNNNNQTLSGSTTFNNLTINHTGTGAVSAAGSTLAVTSLLRLQSGTLTSSSTFNNVQIDAGTTLIGTNGTTMNVSGNWTNNGTFTPSNNIVNFNGANNTQTISGNSTAFDNLVIAHTGTGGVSLSADVTVNTLLTFTSGTITTNANSVVVGAAASINRTSGHVIGALKKISVPASFTFHVGTASGYTPLALANVTGGGDLSVRTNTPQQPTLNGATSLHEFWTLSQTGTLTGDLSYTYLATDVFGNETLYRIIRVTGATVATFNNAAGCPPSGSPCVNPATHTATINGVSAFGVGPTFVSDWTVGQAVPSAASGVVTGRITTTNGAAVAGAVVNLAGTQTRKTITDAGGNYQFSGVETNGFYTVTPARANFSFSPASRSFSQLSERTEAVFTGTAGSEAANPLDTAEYFVRQQYVDLLGREPDEGGFNYWSEQILGCGSDAACQSARRRDVAAAFFIEAEFQRTGAYVYGLYKGALGRQPVYQEFTSDRQQVVDGPNLEALKQEFAESFVGRAEFVTRYQAATSGEAFVDALVASIRASAGIDLGAERATFIGQYNAGGSLVQSRSLALRAMTESAAFRQAEYNAAFVLTEYFSYLRRDPDAGGYSYWLEVLNNREPENYRGMVCAFITSREYQQRFSTIVSRTNSDCGR